MRLAKIFKQKKIISIKLLMVGFLFTATFITTSAAISAPRLNLFPRDVTEHIGNTGRVAKNMETNLKDAIADLETQMKLYDASGCEGSSDPGCTEIAKQMGDRYQGMLNVMKKHLPEMKQSIMATNKGIQKNLRQELGKKSSPSDIQRMLSKSSKPKVFNGRFSLSRRFAKYNDLISSGSKSSLASLASEIYLDSNEVLKMIDIMEAEMAQQETVLQIGNMYGTLTPEMTNTVSSIKSVIFGEEEGGQYLPDASNPEDGGFHSPLEME